MSAQGFSGMRKAEFLMEGCVWINVADSWAEDNRAQKKNNAGSCYHTVNMKAIHQDQWNAYQAKLLRKL